LMVVKLLLADPPPPLTAVQVDTPVLRYTPPLVTATSLVVPVPLLGTLVCE